MLTFAIIVALGFLAGLARVGLSVLADKYAKEFDHQIREMNWSARQMRALTWRMS